MRVVYAGFDALDVAFQGALPEEVLVMLDGAKDAAQVNHEPELVQIGDVIGHVAETGAMGGYRYRLDTGPEGEIWFFKRSRKRDDWNIRVSVKSTQLAIYGWRETRDRLYSKLEEMGASVLNESIGRVDFAVDILAPDFRLIPENFIASWQTRRMVHHDVDAPDLDDPTLDNVEQDQDATVAYVGPNVSTVTLGKMPGRQVQVYDKRREVIDRALHKGHWWDIWGLDKDDPDARVWRVELRAGKDHLKDRGITTWADFEEKIGTLFFLALDEVRYVTPSDDSNRSRWGLHPIWQMVSVEVCACLREYRGQVDRGRVISGHRERLKLMYEGLIKGLAASYSVAAGEYDPEALSGIVGDMMRDVAASKEFEGKRGAASKRLIFIGETDNADTYRTKRCVAETHGWAWVRKARRPSRRGAEVGQLPERPDQAPF